MYRKVVQNYKSISYETFDFHVKKLIFDGTLKKNDHDPRYRNRKVDHYLTNRAKRQIKLKIFESKPDREKYNFLKETDSLRRTKLYFLILVGLFPQTDESDEQFTITISEDKFEEIISSSNLKTGQRIVDHTVYDENSPLMLEDWEIEYYNETTPDLLILCYDKLKESLRYRPKLANRLQRLERTAKMHKIDIYDLVTGFFSLKQITTFTTSNNFLIDKFEFGLKMDEYHEKPFTFHEYTINVRGFTIGNIMNQKFRKFYHHINFTRDEILQVLNLSIEDGIIIQTRFLGTRYIILDSGLEQFLDRLAKLVYTMLNFVINLSEFFKPTLEERQYLEVFLGKHRTDRLFTRPPGFRHLEARFGYTKEAIDSFEKAMGSAMGSTHDRNRSTFAGIPTREYFNSIINEILLFRHDHINIIEKYEVPLKSIMKMTCPETLIMILSDKVKKL